MTTLLPIPDLSEASSGLTSSDFKKLLETLYYTAGLPSAYSSPRVLYKEAKKLNSNVTQKDVDEFLRDQHVNQAFRKPKYTFNRRKIERGISPDFCWELDLFFMLKFKKFNSNYQYCLVALDQFSLYLYTRPLKTKNIVETSQSFDSIISANDNVSPMFVYADEGTELNFLQRSFEKYEITRYLT